MLVVVVVVVVVDAVGGVDVVTSFAVVRMIGSFHPWGDDEEE